MERFIVSPPYTIILFNFRRIYTNAIRTTFDLNFDLYQAFKQHGFKLA